MSEFEDRQDAAPAIETPAAPLTPAPETDHEALAAVEGADARPDESDAVEGSDTLSALSDGPAQPVSPPTEEAEANAEMTSLAASDNSGGQAVVAEMAEPSAEPHWAVPLAAGYSDRRPAADDEAPLLDDELEHGIASVFAALHSAAQNAEADLAEEAIHPLDESEAIDGITFRLLGELDRLWHRAA